MERLSKFPGYWNRSEGLTHFPLKAARETPRSVGAPMLVVPSEGLFNAPSLG